MANRKQLRILKQGPKVWNTWRRQQPDELEGVQPYTEFQQLPRVIAQAPAYNPSVLTAQNGQAAHIYATQSNRGTWFNQGGSHEGANS